jgi:nicotinate-nucleotide adenylyltransferase
VRIGYFGGSFDPVHNGHIILIQCVRDALELDRFFIAPTNRPPHKPAREFADIGHRISMLELATNGLPEVEIHRGETQRQTTYTVDALRALAAERPGSEFHLVIGGDSFDEFETWRDPDEIIALASLAVYARPGAHLRARWPHVRVDGPLVEISSSDIRRRLARDLSVAGWVPESVAAYVAREGLYRPGGRV